jgi:hypothetical protein
MASTMNNGQFTLRKTKMICKVTIKLKKNNKFIKMKKNCSHICQIVEIIVVMFVNSQAVKKSLKDL